MNPYSVYSKDLDYSEERARWRSMAESGLEYLNYASRRHGQEKIFPLQIKGLSRDSEPYSNIEPPFQHHCRALKPVYKHGFDSNFPTFSRGYSGNQNQPLRGLYTVVHTIHTIHYSGIYNKINNLYTVVQYGSIVYSVQSVCRSVQCIVYSVCASIAYSVQCVQNFNYSV